MCQSHWIGEDNSYEQDFFLNAIYCKFISMYMIGVPTLTSIKEHFEAAIEKLQHRSSQVTKC